MSSNNILNPYNRNTNDYSKNSIRNQLVDDTLREFIEAQGIDVTDYKVGQITFLASFKDPTTIVGNTTPLFVSYQDQVYIVPPQGQGNAYPITPLNTGGFVNSISGVAPDPQDGDVEIAGSNIDIVKDVAGYKVTISADTLKALIDSVDSKVDTNTQQIASNSAGISSLNQDVADLKSNEITSIKSDDSTLNIAKANKEYNLSVNQLSPLNKRIKTINSQAGDANNDFKIESTDSTVNITNKTNSIDLSIVNKVGVEKIGNISPNATGEIGLESTEGTINFSAGTASNNLNINAVPTTLSEKLISSDAGNQLSQSSTDSKLYVSPAVGGVDSINSKTGAVNLVAGSNITISSAGADTIQITGTGGGGSNVDFSDNRAIYVGTVAGGTPDGSYTLPYGKDSVQTAINTAAASSSKNSVLPVTADKPIINTTNTELTISTRDTKVLLGEMDFIGNFVTDLSGVTDAGDSETIFEFNDVTSASTLFKVAPINNASTNNFQEFNLTVNSADVNEDVQLFEFTSSTTTSGTPSIFVNINIDLLRSLSSAEGSPTTALIDLDRNSVIGLNKVTVRLRVKIISLNPSEPSTKINVVINKEPLDRVELISDNSEEFLARWLDLSGVDSIISSNAIRDTEILAGTKLKAPIFENKASLPAPSEDGSIAVLEDSNGFTFYVNGEWREVTASSVATEELPVYYDESYTGTLETGEFTTPFKTLQSAITSAVSKQKTLETNDPNDARQYTVVNKPTANSINNSNLTIGSTNTNTDSTSIKVKLLGVNYSGTISISAETAGILPCFLEIEEFEGVVNVINVNTLAQPTDPKENGLEIFLKSAKKIIKDVTKESFICDLSSLSNSSVIEPAFIDYTEDIDYLAVLDQNVGAIPVTNIIFSLPLLEDSSFSAKTNIRTFRDILDQSGTPNPADYISFVPSAGGQFDPSLILSASVNGVGIAASFTYDFSQISNSTNRSIVTASDLESSSAILDNLEVKGTTNSVVTNTSESLGLPITPIAVPQNNSLYVDNSFNKVVFKDGLGRLNYLALSDPSTTEDREFTAGGQIVADSNNNRIIFPEIDLVDSLKKEVMHLPQTNVTCQLELNPNSGNTVLALPLNEWNFASDGNFNSFAYTLLESGLTISLADASTTNENLVTVIFNVNTQQSQKFTDNLQQGFIVTLSQGGSDRNKLSVAIAVQSFLVTTTQVTITGIPSFSNRVENNGVLDFSIPENIAAANAVTYTDIYLGCRGDFNPAIKHLKTKSRESLKVWYYPVVYSDDIDLQTYSIILFPYVPTLSAEDAYGQRALIYSKIPPIFKEELATMWSITESQISSQLLSIPFEVFAYKNASIANSNASRYVREVVVDIEGGNRYNATYIISPSDANNAFAAFADGNYSSATAYPVTAFGNLADSENYIASLFGDEASISEYRVKVVSDNYTANAIASAFNGGLSDSGGNLIVITKNNAISIRQEYTTTLSLNAGAGDLAVGNTPVSQYIEMSGNVVIQSCGYSGYSIFTAGDSQRTVKQKSVTVVFRPKLSAILDANDAVPSGFTGKIAKIIS